MNSKAGGLAQALALFQMFLSLHREVGIGLDQQLFQSDFFSGFLTIATKEDHCIAYRFGYICDHIR